jgi:hypothetical protein
MAPVGRPRIPGVPRPPCPRGHVGTIRLNGRDLDAQGRFERTRYRCVPADKGEKEHVFQAPLAARREMSEAGHECDACERPFQRAEGVASGWRFAFSVRDVATALVRVGKGDSYREIGLDLRSAVGRRRVRGEHPGGTPVGAQLVIDYLDGFAAIIDAAVAPSAWPPILAIDSKPVFVPDHSLCCKPYRDCGERPPRHDKWGPPEDEPAEPGKKKYRPKISHDAPMIEIGAILVAVGYAAPGAPPRPYLIRFAGGHDEVSWTEFLESLPGTPEWVVSDRDGAISNAVVAAFGPDTVHYFCEQRIAQNAADWAREKDHIKARAQLMGITEMEHPIWPFLEAAQYDADHWMAAMDAAVEYDLPRTAKWIADRTTLMTKHWAKRRPGYQRSAGACEDVIKAVFPVIAERMPHFQNADRLNLLLALARAERERVASVSAYSRILRAAFSGAGGKANPNWAAIRDPTDGDSSIRLLYEETTERAKAAKARRAAPNRAAFQRGRRAAYEAERVALGLPPSPRGRPRIVRAQGSVAGKHVADFGWLVAEWHPTLNGNLTPEEVQAGSGTMVWWKCSAGPDHEWASQVRSRTLRGTGCPFCAHRAIAPSENLATTHKDIAASWHPTRNGTKTPADYTYGSHAEVWWQCPKYKSHVWRAHIASPTAMLTGCSLCPQAEGRRGRGPRADAVEASQSA